MVFPLECDAFLRTCGHPQRAVGRSRLFVAVKMAAKQAADAVRLALRRGPPKKAPEGEIGVEETPLFIGNADTIREDVEERPERFDEIDVHTTLTELMVCAFQRA